MFVGLRAPSLGTQHVLHSVCPVLQSRQVCKCKTMQWRPWIQAIEWLFEQPVRLSPACTTLLSAAWRGVTELHNEASGEKM